MTGFDQALRGTACWRLDSDGARHRLPVRRWHGPCRRPERLLLGRLSGPTLDVGCGPGRLTAAVTARGVPALGVDSSAVAVRLTRGRGAAAVHRSVFERLPAEGRWRHVLLADGNIGIGGDPHRLLDRCADLLGSRGTVLAELDPPGTGVWRGTARLVHPYGHGYPFPWARVGVDGLHRLVAALPLALLATYTCGGRWFAELERR